MVLSGCRKLRCLSSCKKSYLSVTSFLKYYKDIANLLLLVLWACLATPTISDSTTLYETLGVSPQTKNQLDSSSFSGDITY